MAAIAIIEKDGLFTIELDQNDWTGLTVNGAPVQEGATGWKFVQTVQGKVNFVASADYCTTVNPDATYVIKGEHGQDYSCELTYSNTSTGAPFTMTGTLSSGQNLPGAQVGPIVFSQGMMAGSFSTVQTQIFRLTTVSQNDPGCLDGEDLFATVTNVTGGTLLSSSSPMNQKVSLPIPPPPGHAGPPSPTWFLELNGSIDDASFTVEISGPADYTTTTIVVEGADMAAWIAASKKVKTNQIYATGASGIFGYAQEDNVVDGSFNWIYTITAGVVNPMVHPPSVAV